MRRSERGATLSIRFRHVLTAVIAMMSLLGALWPALASAQSDERTIKIQVQDQTQDATGKTVRTFVAGVSVQVLDASGAVIGEGVTDDKGVLLVPVPGPDAYTVVLDESTLPDGTALSERTPAEREVIEDQFLSSTITINYFTGEGSRTSTGFFSRLAQRLVDGSRLGLILAMCSVGIRDLRTTGLTNFGTQLGTSARWRRSSQLDLGLMRLGRRTMGDGDRCLSAVLDTTCCAVAPRDRLISQLVVTGGMSICSATLPKQFGGTRQYEFTEDERHVRTDRSRARSRTR